MSAADPTKRFSAKVDNYVRYRPSYPVEVLTVLRDEIGFAPDWIVADVGSGTGISSALFLENGNTVYGVEPNDEMRRAAESLLAGNPRFHSVAATAEATTLLPASIDLIVAGQAFHWFKRDEARAEFARVLRPNGWVVLLWNSRLTDTTPFLRGYEALLHTFGTDYQEVNHTNIGAETLRGFFTEGKFELRNLPNEQRFDLAGLTGRLLSSSYVPGENDPRYRPMLAELERLFRAHQEHGQVRVEYDTELYIGHV